VDPTIYDSAYINWQIANDPKGPLAAFFKFNPVADARIPGLSSSQLLFFMKKIITGDDASTERWFKACFAEIKKRYTIPAGFTEFRKSWSHDILTVALEYFGADKVSEMLTGWHFKDQYFEDILPLLAQIRAEKKLEEYLR